MKNKKLKALVIAAISITSTFAIVLVTAINSYPPIILDQGGESWWLDSRYS